MKDYTLSKEQIAALEKLHPTLPDKRQADSVKTVSSYIYKQLWCALLSQRSHRPAASARIFL